MEVCPKIRTAIAESNADAALAEIAKAGVGMGDVELGSPEDVRRIEEQWSQTSRSRMDIAFRALAVVLAFAGNPAKMKTGKKKKAKPDPVPAGIAVLREMLAQWTEGGAGDDADAADAADAESSEQLATTPLGKVLRELGVQKLYGVWLSTALALLVCMSRGMEALLFAAFRVPNSDRAPSLEAFVGKMEAVEERRSGRARKQYRLRRLLNALARGVRRLQASEEEGDAPALGDASSPPRKGRRLFHEKEDVCYSVQRVPVPGPQLAAGDAAPLVDLDDEERSRRVNGEALEEIVNGACATLGFEEPLRSGEARLQCGVDAMWTRLLAGRIVDKQWTLEVSDAVHALVPFLRFFYRALVVGMREDGWEILRGISWYLVIFASGERLRQNVDGQLIGSGYGQLGLDYLAFGNSDFSIGWAPTF